MRIGKVVMVVMALGMVLAQAGWAQGGSSPVGRWRTMDDATGKAKSIVTLYLENGKLYGKVEKILDPDPTNPQEICRKCEGEQHNQPIVGLRMLWDMTANGAEWGNGMILDPHTGSTYRCLMTVVDNGTRLKVRGYVGVPMLGRTQYWVREP